jgi:rod shape-determining protein MreC
VGPFLKKYRELILASLMLALPMVTYVAHAQKPFVPGPVRNGIVWATSPIQRAIVWTVSSAQDAWYGYVDLRHTHQENLELRRQVLALRVRDERVDELQAENARLRRIVSFDEAQSDIRLVTASVVAFGPDPKFRSIRIGRGSVDGIRQGMPVVTPDGVVGRVSRVYEAASDVLLIIDPTSAVAALSQRTRTRATARGVGDVTRIRLDFIVKSDDIEEGDILVTAPSGGLFPKGLRMGRVTHVTESSDSSHGLFKGAELIPAVDFDRLEEVQVVMDNGPSAARELPITSSIQ